MESPPGPETVIDGVSYLYFGGTSYMGLAGHPEVVEAGCEALRRYGVHSATSRSRIGTIPPVREVERLAAEYFGTEEAFYYGSGYMSNHILVSALAGGMDAVLLDEGSHYSVAEAARLPGVPVIPFAHGDPAALAAAAAPYRRILVMADGVGPSMGEAAPVEEFVRVVSGFERAVLLLDDAHGVGVLGAQGRGVLEELGMWELANGGAGCGPVELAVGGTLSKALGGFGGIIPGTRAFTDAARRASHYFDGASAPPSAAAGSTAKALEILLREPERRAQLHRNVARLREGLRTLPGLTVPEGRTAHFGVTAGGRRDALVRIHEGLKQRGILVPFVDAYSGIPDGGILRFAVFATHTTGQIDRLIAEVHALL